MAFVEHLGTLRLRAVGLEAELLGRRFVDEDVRVGGAGGLLGAAGVGEQALHGALHVDRRLVGDGQRGVDRLPEETGKIGLLSPPAFRRGFTVKRLSTVCRGVGACTCSGKVRSSFISGLSIFTCTSVRPMAVPASSGMRRMRFCWSRVCELLLAVLDDQAVAVADLDPHFLLGAGEVVHVEREQAESPTERKRGVASSTTSGAATVTSASCMPKRSPLAATAIRRRLPLKSGTARLTSASLLASSATGPLNRSTRRTFFGRLLVGLAASPPPLELALLPGHGFDEGGRGRRRGRARSAAWRRRSRAGRGS